MNDAPQFHGPFRRFLLRLHAVLTGAALLRLDMTWLPFTPMKASFEIPEHTTHVRLLRNMQWQRGRRIECRGVHDGMEITTIIHMRKGRVMGKVISRRPVAEVIR